LELKIVGEIDDQPTYVHRLERLAKSAQGVVFLKILH
jgi:hypothetical protein